MRIEVVPDELEATDREALEWLSFQKLDAAGVRGELDLAKGQLKRVRRRLDKKSGPIWAAGSFGIRATMNCLSVASGGYAISSLSGTRPKLSPMGR